MQPHSRLRDNVKQTHANDFFFLLVSLAVLMVAFAAGKGDLLPMACPPDLVGAQFCLLLELLLRKCLIISIMYSTCPTGRRMLSCGVRVGSSTFSALNWLARHSQAALRVGKAHQHLGSPSTPPPQRPTAILTIGRWPLTLLSMSEFFNHKQIANRLL